MPDFTKGNWVFWKNKKYPYWYVGKEGSERYIATVDKEANARLIAAAPDMYELLKECMKKIHSFDDTYRRIEALLNEIDGGKEHEE